jgi:peroxiredoxin
MSLVAELEQVTQTAIAMDAPIGERLRLIADAVRALPGNFAEAVDQFVGRLMATGAGEFAPAPGDAMPPFVLPDEKGRLTSLDSILAEGPAAIVFLRGHWCPYCRLTAAALAQTQADVRALGARIVVISPELHAFSTTLKEQSRGEYPILADIDNGYALSINLAIWVDEAMSGLIAGAGWDIPKYTGNGSWLLPIPATFVLDRDGVIRARFVDPDYRRRMDLDDLKSALRDVATRPAASPAPATSSAM